MVRVNGPASKDLVVKLTRFLRSLCPRGVVVELLLIHRLRAMGCTDQVDDEVVTRRELFLSVSCSSKRA